MFNPLGIIIRYWDLILGLAIKDLKIRYKSAFLGFLWSILTPLFLTFIFFIVFTKIIPMGIERYPLFLLCALFPWNFLQLCLGIGTVSIVSSSHLIKKVYFPREVIPISVIFSNAYNFILSLFILLIALIFCRVSIRLTIVYLPFVFLCQSVFMLGLLLLFSGLHTYYRDVKYIVEIMLLGWFYLTPIFYSIELIPQVYRKIYMLNPMTVFVKFYREIILYGIWPDIFEISYLILISVLTYIIGILVFKKFEPIFADVT